MSVDHRNARAAQVSKALGILESDGDAAVEEYLFPLGMGWVKYYAGRLEDALSALKAYRQAVEDERIYSGKFDLSSVEYRTRYPFVGLAHAARQIIGFASGLERLFREHLNYDFTDRETADAESDAFQRKDIEVRKEFG